MIAIHFWNAARGGPKKEKVLDSYFKTLDPESNAYTQTLFMQVVIIFDHKQCG
jgi:hypothetical protein